MSGKWLGLSVEHSRPHALCTPVRSARLSFLAREQAVELWQASTGQGSAVADQEGDAAEPQAQQRQQQHAADSPELRQQYVSSLKPLLFQVRGGVRMHGSP